MMKLLITSLGILTAGVIGLALKEIDDVKITND